MAQYEMENVHLNDKTCVFDQEDDEFYTREISPLTECGTHVKVIWFFSKKSSWKVFLILYVKKDFLHLYNKWPK